MNINAERAAQSEQRRAAFTSSLKLIAFLCSLFALSCSFFAACVPVDELPAGSVPLAPSTSTNTATAYADLEQGGTSITSAHFTLKGYNPNDLDSLKQMAETEYDKIGNDTGLYSFMASGNYTLVEYKDREEYLAKTHQPSWSHAVVAGNAIYFYIDPDLAATLAHYLVHMVFGNYMADKAASLKWLDEGLAMNQEVANMTTADRTAYSSSKSSQLQQNKMALSQMVFFVTNTEEKRRTDAWYQETESVVTYLLSQGSALAFAQMLGELRTGADFDHALSDAYGAKFRDMNDLENSWKNSI